ASGLVLVSNVVLYASYATSDDVALRMITEGRFIPGAPPSAETHFMSLVFGRVLVWLHAAAPGVAWYDLSLEGTLAVSLMLAVRILQVRCTDLFRPTLAVVSAAFLWMFAFPAFTVASIIGSGIGALVLLLFRIGGMPGFAWRSRTVMLTAAVAVIVM